MTKYFGFSLEGSQTGIDHESPAVLMYCRLSLRALLSCIFRVFMLADNRT